ncbi:Hypothetical protein NTJ_03475 [Nesidiocoris tenuis]|uniref:Uncharacterized protein n=1 Tax=Nesidiocoris tenuis TaxID=355587 RepID=A0ABN7AJY7_9HEMI|nr:Hypothetical protein NTJ_03475 [Nesidiocoris tenuis]
MRALVSGSPLSLLPSPLSVAPSPHVFRSCSRAPSPRPHPPLLRLRLSRRVLYRSPATRSTDVAAAAGSLPTAPPRRRAAISERRLRPSRGVNPLAPNPPHLRPLYCPSRPSSLSCSAARALRRIPSSRSFAISRQTLRMANPAHPASPPPPLAPHPRSLRIIFAARIFANSRASPSRTLGTLNRPRVFPFPPCVFLSRFALFLNLPKSRGHTNNNSRTFCLDFALLFNNKPS